MLSLKQKTRILGVYLGGAINVFAKDKYQGNMERERVPR